MDNAAPTSEVLVGVGAGVGTGVGRRRDSILSNKLVGRSAAAGVGFIVLGFGLEWLFAYLELSHLEALARASKTAEVLHPALFTMNWQKVVILLCKELGVAFLVAAIIGWAIDKQAEERNIERTLALQKDIATDAVFALFGLRHQRNFIKAVIETNLEAAVVRSDMSLIYSLRTLTEDECNLVFPNNPDAALQRFVILEMLSQYTFENVSSAIAPVVVRNNVARRRGDGARAVTRATYLCLDGKPIPEGDLAQALVSAPAEDELRYEWRRDLKPGETLKVIAKVQTLKERSDNEVWGSFYPTMDGLDITFRVLSGMNFGVRDLGSAKLGEEPAAPVADQKKWRLVGPMLKHNSVVFWWRIHEDDALDGQTPENEFSDPPPLPEDVEKAPPQKRRMARAWEAFWEPN